MTDIEIAVVHPDQTPWQYATVAVRLVDAGTGGAVEERVISGTQRIRCDENGEATVDLTPNSEITPAGTCYALAVEGASPSTVVTIEVPASGGPYAWTDDAIQAANPVPPVLIPLASVGEVGQVLGVVDEGNGKKYDLVDQSGGGAIAVDGVIAADAVDGTGVQFTALVLDHGATAAGIVPAGWAGVPGLTDLDATELAALLAMGWPSGATFIVYSDGDWSVRFITDDTVNAPWTIVSAVDVTGGSLGSLVDGEFYETHAWRVLYSGTGLFDGQTNAGDAMHQFEGSLDRWFFASAVGTTDKDLADLGAETWEYGDLKFTDGNSDPVDFCHVWLFGQTDPAENGAYTVNDDFTYAKIPHPDVFDPPGQGYRVTVVAPGDPASGTTWVWLVDKPDTHFRANGSTDPDEAGEWVLWIDPVGGGGAVTLAGDVTGTGTGTITTAIGAGVIVDADVNASAAIAQSKIASLTSDLAAKAPLASPALTGNPTAPTQSAGNNSTRLATTAYTDTAVAAVPLPWLDHIYIPSARYPDALTGTWGVTAAAVIGGGYTGSALTNDQSYTYARLPIRAGTYTMRVYRRNTANSGIITITLGGSSVGTVDAYSASSANDTLSTITGITVSASGFLNLVLTNPTKNASSGAYEMRFQLIDLYRTGP